MRKLNVGCGKFKKAGFVNLDWVEDVHPDVTHDLNKFPYPFADNSFDWVEADHVLEHMENPFGVMKEIHRISAPGAIVIIRVPHFSRGFSHPEHKSGFDVTFPYFFRADFPGDYMGVEFELIRLKLFWFAQKYLKKQVLPRPLYLCASALGFILSWLANLSPVLCARIWCFWVGGFEQIEYVFKVKK